MNNKFRVLNAKGNTDTFVGINYEGNEISIYFPLGYRIPKEDNLLKISILELIEAINITKMPSFNNNYGVISGECDEIPINSYIWLIRDYLTNGLYYDTEKSFRQNIKGKINWKRTLKTKFYISNKNIAYLDFITEKSSKEANIITEIEIFCLKKSIERVGWLFGDISVSDVLTNEKSIEYYLKVLQYELVNSFNDHKKILINHLIRILTEKSNKIGYNSKKYGTYSFNLVWEKMVDKVFGNLKSKEFFPSSKYKLINGKEIKTSDMIPDTVLKYNQDLYILDSKYYKFGIDDDGFSTGLPSTESIEKQVIYAKYADRLESKRQYDYHNVYNAFIIPYNRVDNRFDTQKVIKYIGYAQSGAYRGLYSYERIALILIDTKYLMDCYFKKEQGDIKKLVEAIQNIK